MILWREVLPGMALMYVFLVIPGVSTAKIQWWANGGREKRLVNHQWHWRMLDRDRRVAGSDRHYDSKGLENIN